MPWLHRVAYGALIGQLIAVLVLVPGSMFHALGEPTTLATFCTVAVTLFLIASRLAGTDRFDRLVLAVFLAGMALIYAWAAILHGGSGDLGIELAGVLLFGGFAVMGYARRPLLLGIGIIAHGLAWDSWHHGHSSFIPDWYSAGCLVTDLGVGVFTLIAVRGAARPRAVAVG